MSTLSTLGFVYVGPLALGATCEQRLRAILSLGHDVTAVNTSMNSRFADHLVRLVRPIASGLDLAGIHDRLLSQIREKKPQILWVDKGLTIGREILEEVRSISPATFQISYSPDDMLNPSNQTRRYVEAIPSYHLHVTTKSLNVDELKDLGAPDVLFVNNAFCPWTHRPMEVTGQDRRDLGGPVGFIGFPEADRRRSIEHLGRNGVPVRVWGPWSRHTSDNVRVEGRSLWGEAYTKAICAFDIVLGFLRSENRDVQTTRSIEIPACGAFMLAERSEEHLALFKEGEEAEFFGSDEELLDKTRYYLTHSDLRAKIAAAGRRRCLESGYDNPEMIRTVLRAYHRSPAGDHRNQTRIIPPGVCDRARRTLRIVYAGSLFSGGTSAQRLADLRTLGHQVVSIDTWGGHLEGEGCPPLAARALTKLGKSGENSINQELLAKVANFSPDLIWIDKGLKIRKSTLLRIKEISTSTCIVHYSPDDMLNPANQSQNYLAGLPVYDIHVTTKSYNVAELRELGARNVVFVEESYCPSVHRPVPVSVEDKARFGGPVGFTGYPEAQRQRSIEYLAGHGVPVRVWGPWKRRRTACLQVEGRSLWRHAYAKAICAFDINLCFLRKANRDLQTSRSIEIPACGAFMLAERTEEHLGLFKEGEEAEFFSTDEEMLEKVRHYLVHSEEREKIAAAGRRRCLESGYRNVDRIAQVLDSYQRLSDQTPRFSRHLANPWK